MSNIFIGIKPGQAITYLREITTTPLQPYDIYNLNASFRREQRHGLSANDALIRYLKDKGVYFKINITPTNRTRHLFITYSQSIELTVTKRRLTASDCPEGNRRDCNMSGNQTSGKEGGV